MPADAKEVLKFFRGKRMIALFAVVGVVAFLVFGGHRKAIGFAVDEMAGFLLGAGDLKDEKMAEGGEIHEYAAGEKPSEGGLLSAGSILKQVGVSEAMAAPVEEVPSAAEGPVLAQATADPPIKGQSATGEMPAESGAVARKTGGVSPASSHFSRMIPEGASHSGLAIEWSTVVLRL